MFARSVRRLAAAPAIASLALAAAASAAPVQFGDSSYDLVLDTESTWTEARDAASESGGSLALISSAEEQSFVESLLLDRAAPTGSYWFGIQDVTDQGTFRSVDDEPLTFTNFAPGEPNDGAGVGESVGGIYWTEEGGDPATLSRRGGWNDLPEEGYPNDGVAGNPAQADLFRAGYIVEFAADSIGGPGDGDGTDGGDGDGTGGGDGDGDGDGGGATPIPLPAAALTFPATAALALLAARRVRRR